ncbi:MAG: DUF1254 domain-containing protein [Xanthomonadales bacterium]|nr:DUF1254 domain-containing protein [Xanthomonadales bacterium]
MKHTFISAMIFMTITIVISPLTAMAQTDHYQALANAPFVEDYPTAETTRTLDEELYFQRAVQTYLWALPAVNMYAMKEGQARTFGEGYNVFAIFEKRLKANTIITTPNSDVIYGIGFLDLGKDGPMVIDAPPMLQALLDDFWHRPLIGPEIDGIQYLGDIGLPGPDKGKGGKYLILPPGYEGEVDENEYFVYRSRTNGVFVFLRGFFDDANNLKPAVENMEKIRIYPLQGEARPMDFKHASDVAANYLFARDASYFEMLNRFIQSDVVDDVDPYMHGVLAMLGIYKGMTFAPNERERELLDAAALTAWKMAKNIAANSDRLRKGLWWEDSFWIAHGKTELDDFMYVILDEEFKDRASKFTDANAKAHMFINHYSISTAMITSRVGIGAKYAGAYKDSNGDYLVGDHSYKITLPANVPARLFWSLTAYDFTTASGLDNGQKYPSIGSRDNPLQNADGSTTIYFAPMAPKGKEKNWVKTVPGKGWFCLIRLYGPDQAFFDRTWIPGDFEKME